MTNALLDRPMEALKLDKSNWTPTKFGEVAIQQKEVCRQGEYTFNTICER
jgi:hypothetical protein